ncbi:MULTISPECIES: type VI secretion system baseplate subunit TssF [unclassified Phyllobacterium]|uniref:type VI secretion system baseplate subunit TssF n=1 Tax=unclassified Phyllobacterium TaxID=2638441 RepID=UPI003012B9D0
MANRFLAWYNRELGALRKRASVFAHQHPKVAGRLRLTPEAVDDPHVERLIQGFAYSAARVRQKLDDDFPELTETLLESLYPHYLAQIPSMSILKFNPSDQQDETIDLPRGMIVDSEPVRGDTCRFTTTQSLALSPVALTDCKLAQPPYVAPPVPDLTPMSCLSFRIKTTGPVTTIAELDLDALTFFIKAPFITGAALYELLFNHTLGIAIGRHREDKAALRLPPNALKPLGFEHDRRMLPYSNRSFPGFRLLAEFFALPEKFLFFELKGLKSFLSGIKGNEFHIFFYLDTPANALAKAVDLTSFDLHCTPVINLFEQRAEPISVNHTQNEYDLLPDARYNSTREIYAIERVNISDQKGNRKEVPPFFGRKKQSNEKNADMFWQYKREIDDDSKSFKAKIRFVDMNLDPTTPEDHLVASIDALCLNRGLPELLPFGGGQPYFGAQAKVGEIGKISCLLPPTHTHRFESEGESYWKLISHLSLNHLPLTSGDPEILKSMLRLYDFRRSPEMRSMIEAIASVTSRKATARLSDGTIASGVDVTVEFTDALMDRGQAYLFGSVLSHFFGLYASINTFSRLTVRLSGLALPVVRFSPRTAEEVLL